MVSQGEGFELDLELKSFADVGLVGFPSVNRLLLICNSKYQNQSSDYLYNIESLNWSGAGLWRAVFVADLPGLVKSPYRCLVSEFISSYIERTKYYFMRVI